MQLRKLRFTVALVALVALVLSQPALAGAMTLRQGNAVTVRADETINDDVYAFGSTVSIDGTVNGDVVAAGQTVIVTGHVAGGVFGAGQVVRVGGPVDGSVRAAGQTVEVSDKVAGDALLAGSSVTIANGASIGRDAAIGANDASVLGDVKRNLDVGASNVTIGGKIGGDVRAQGQTIQVLPSGTIDGNLEYWSDSKPQVMGTVSGTTTGHALPHNNRNNNREGAGAANAAVAVAWLVVGWIQSFIGMVLFGLILVLGLPRFTRQSTDVVLAEPWPSLGFGCLTFLFVPAVAFIVFFVGLLVGGWWMSFMLLAVYGIALAAAVIIGAIAFGRVTIGHGNRPIHPVWLMLFGLAAIWIVGLVPIIGGLGALAAMLFGLGGVTIASWHGLRAQHPPRAPQTALPTQPAAHAPAPTAPPQPYAPPAPAVPPTDQPTPPQ